MAPRGTRRSPLAGRGPGVDRADRSRRPAREGSDGRLTRAARGSAVGPGRSRAAPRRLRPRDARVSRPGRPDSLLPLRPVRDSGRRAGLAHVDDPGDSTNGSRGASRWRTSRPRRDRVDAQRGRGHARGRVHREDEGASREDAAQDGPRIEERLSTLLNRPPAVPVSGFVSVRTLRHPTYRVAQLNPTRTWTPSIVAKSHATAKSKNVTADPARPETTRTRDEPDRCVA